MLEIDGSYGEGGGQILRTALALAAIQTRPIRLINIRVRRKNPGLAAQHLTAVRAAAMICEAELAGDKLGSTTLTFAPQTTPVAGFYEFDVAEAREGGSAGAATLVLQTVLLPLALAGDTSVVTLRGGTHVPWSPSFHYVNEVYLPTLARLGIEATAKLRAWGWYPAGEGEIELTIAGSDRLDQIEAEQIHEFGPKRGELKQISGVAVASSLPARIAQRMRNRAANLLAEAGLPAAIEPQRVRSVSPGAGIFLTAEYEASIAGFSALGKKGKPSEHVAEEAVNDLLTFHRSQAAVEAHLADQLILPWALTKLPGVLSTEWLTEHILTNIWVVEQFFGPAIRVDHKRGLIQFFPPAGGGSTVW
jgi:RNA 3'-terminal phosphate cyclase (ATP)